MASFGDYNRVNTNVTAMDAQLSLNKINRDLGESRLRLSTGFKINNAEDDAAGFAIATKLKSRVAGLEQALQNVSDAKSVLGVAEASYNSVVDNLIEMKSLATQAANGIIEAGSDEMGYIASQLEALGDDINDIAKSTTYNGVDLMNSQAALTFQVGEGTDDTMAVTLSELNMGTLFNTSINNAEETHAASIHSSEVLGSTSAGGKPTYFQYTTQGGNGSQHTTPSATTAGYHLFSAFDKDFVDHDSASEDATVNAAETIGAADGSSQRGASIVVRGYNIASGTTGSDFNDKLLIDESTVNDADMRSFITHIDNAIGTMNSKLNQIGIDQSSLSGREVNLSESITANSAARSRIMDTDFAKEQSNSIRLQILQQTATAALSQANMGPQAVLGFLG
jgi:flagellin